MDFLFRIKRRFRLQLFPSFRSILATPVSCCASDISANAIHPLMTCASTLRLYSATRIFTFSNTPSDPEPLMLARGRSVLGAYPPWIWVLVYPQNPPKSESLRQQFFVIIDRGATVLGPFSRYAEAVAEGHTCRGHQEFVVMRFSVPETNEEGPAATQLP